MKILRKKIFADPWFIDEVLNIQHNYFSRRVQRQTYEGSGWAINLIMQ